MKQMKHKKGKNFEGKSDYVIVTFIGKDIVKIYRHYRHPFWGSLANSGKKVLIAIVPTEEYDENIDYDKIYAEKNRDCE